MKASLLLILTALLAGLLGFTQARAQELPRVTVTDESGTPKPGVKLIAWGLGNDGILTTVVSTNSHGTFDFASAKLPSKGVAFVVAESPGCGMGFANMLPDLRNYTIDLKPQTRASIHLVGPNGEAASNVRVKVVALVRGRGIDAAFINFSEIPSLQPAEVSDSNGVVSFDGLPSDCHVGFDVDDERFAHLAFEEGGLDTGAPASSTALHIKLKPGAVIEGRVIGQGFDLARVKVLAQSENMATGGYDTRQADANGNFRLMGLLPGTYNVELDLPKSLASSWTSNALADVQLKEGEHLRAMNLKLIHGALIYGIVRFTDGSPAPNMEVQVFGPAHPSTSYASQFSLTDSKGLFSERVPAGSQDVSVPQYAAGRDRSKSREKIMIKDGDSKYVELEAVRPPAVTVLSGLVVDEDGKPVADAHVLGASENADSDDPGPAHETSTDFSGHFRILLQANEYPLNLRAAKGQSATLTPIPANKGSAPVKLTLASNALDAVVGHVQDPSGKPIAGASVMLFEQEGNGFNSGVSVRTSADGSYRIEGLWPDKAFFLEARAAGFGVAQSNFNAPGSKTVSSAPMVLQIADSFVEGRVVDENGKAVPNAKVLADPYSIQPTMTDPNGVFRIDSIPKGPVGVRVFKDRRFIERSIHTGTDVVLTLKSAPEAETPPTAAPIVSGANAIELRTTGWVNSDELSLAGLKGKVVVLDFWAVWCGPCNEELSHVEALAKEFAGQPVVVIGVHDSTATVKELVEFAHRKNLNYPLAIDKTASSGFGLTANSYGVQGIPTMVIIGKDGKVAGVPDSDGQAETLVRKLLERVLPRP